MRGWAITERLGGRGRLLALVAAGAIAASAAAAGAPAGAQYEDPGVERPNPCLGELARELRCPDLLMSRPSEMHVTKGRGKVLLHATNNIKSRGEGPLEVRGRRTGKRVMKVRQAIHEVGGGVRTFETDGELVFYNIPGQGPYWKYRFAALFQIWSLDGQGTRDELIRKGPKVNYCFRDLARTKPSKRSPRRRVYPGCSQDPRKRKRTLGTSVGWSDIYPATYYQNWINVTGLRGCFQFVHIADPLNDLFENKEGNNEGATRVRLPAKGRRVRGC